MNIHSLLSARKQMISCTDFISKAFTLFPLKVSDDFTTENSWFPSMYHIWSDFSASICILSYTDSDSYAFIFSLSLYDEGGSNRISLSSTENHMEFSVVQILCPVESPPFHAYLMQSFKASIDNFCISALCLSCWIKLIYHPNRFSYLILIDIPMQSPPTFYSFGMILPDPVSLHQSVFLKSFLVRFLWSFSALKIVCFLLCPYDSTLPSICQHYF